MLKYFRLIILLIFLSPLTNITANNHLKGTTNYLPQIDLLDHAQGRLVIGDANFYFKLNTKVYINKRLVNRYALKVGQNVDLDSTMINGKAMLDRVVILKK